VETFSGSR